MESNYHEESINSSDEVDHSEQENKDLGVGRSYECVFCKRGFNTAQALGGHMNIHRKDRARNKPTSNNSNKQEEIYTGPRLYQQIPASSYGNDQSANHGFASQDHQPGLSYATYLSASTSSYRSLHENNYHHQQYCSDDSDRDHRQPSNSSIPGDCHMSLSLSLEFSPTAIEDQEKNRQAMNQEEDLDLELRLGYDS